MDKDDMNSQHPSRRKWRSRWLLFWLVQTVMFTSFAIYFFYSATHTIPPFQRTPREYSAIGVDISGSGVDEPLDDFIQDMNAYIDSQNTASTTINFISGVDFVIAAIVAGISATRSLPSTEDSRQHWAG